MPKMVIREAIAKGLREALLNDDRVFMVGEDIGDYGGAYAVTRGFLDEFGAKRIIDAPLAESAIVGAAVGAAMGGLRPIAEIMTINFLLLAMDQVVNHAAKLRYMSNGQISVPLLIRTVTGGGGQLAATHSQSFEPWLASVPGLKVATPSNPYDALGLLRTAISEEDPVIFSEHSLLYGMGGEVPDDYYEIPFGQANVVREGDDVTLIGYSRMARVAEQVAERLDGMGTNAEVIDLRTLSPLDMDTVLESVRKTSRAVVVEESWRTGGFAGEIASQIHEQAFDYLDGPVVRVGGMDVPSPYARNLEDRVIPSVESVIAEIDKRLGL